jgi:Family of unknown function (DUF5681)
MPDNRDSDYQVGYGKPPQHTRFKKGESGNPAGRPRHAQRQVRRAQVSMKQIVK